MDETYYTLDNDPDFLNNISSVNTYIKLEELKPHFNQGITDLYHCTRIANGFIYQKGFIRFELNNNDPDLINEAIKEISKINLSLYHNEQYEALYSINLMLNITLLEEYGKTIDLIDVKKILEEYTDEKIDNLILHKNNDCTINTKYMFNNKKGFYLDVPLLNEFYNFESVINNIDDKHNLLYKFYWNDINHLNQNIHFSKYFKTISLGYENVSILKKNSHSKSINHTFDKITVKTTRKLVIDSNNTKIDSYNYNCKYIYIIVYKYNNVILLKPTDAIIYNFTDYDVYKIDYEPDNTFIEFDNIEHPIIIYKIITCLY
jgi:hypothetical protein